MLSASPSVRAPAPLRRRRSRIKWLTAAVSGLVIGAGLLYRIGTLLTPASDVRAADAIVVLGGEWPLRIQRGIELFRQGLAPEIWITGERNAPTLSTMTAELARREGVPNDKIRVLASENTWEDGSATAAMASREHARSILLVTSWYHGRRALCVMDRQLPAADVRLYYDTVQNWTYDQYSWWWHPAGWFRVGREALAFGYYWLRYDMPWWKC